MKTITSGLIALLSYIGIIGCGLWTIVSFIIYLVKDIPFDWRSLWGFILSWCLFFVSLVASAIFSHYEKKSAFDKFKESISHPKKSGFIQRLEQAEAKRKAEIEEQKRNH